MKKKATYMDEIEFDARISEPRKLLFESERDCKIFFDALAILAGPNEKLKEAAALYKKFI